VSEPRESEPSAGLQYVRSFSGSPQVHQVGWSADGAFLAVAGHGGLITFWGADGRKHSVQGHAEWSDTLSLAWRPRTSMLATTSPDRTVRIWDPKNWTAKLFRDLDAAGTGLAWSPDGGLLAVTAADGWIRLLDTRGTMLRRSRELESVGAAHWTADGQELVTVGRDGGVIVWRGEDLVLDRRIGAGAGINDIALSPDGRLLAAAASDASIWLADLASGRQLHVLEQHSGTVGSVRFSADGRFLFSLSDTDGVLVWRCRDWAQASSLPGYRTVLSCHPSAPLIAVEDRAARRVDCYGLDYPVLDQAVVRTDVRRYVNAKVVLLGDTGVGKTGLGLVLSGQRFEPRESTHGRNVWTIESEENREILLWDLAGQPGYRLTHQLHLNEVAVAVFVFDSRSETDPFAGVKYWARALAQARRMEGDSAVPMLALLVAARADRGGIAVSTERIHAMLGDLHMDRFFETSAKMGWQIAELTSAIQDGIDWEALPTIESSNLFYAIKQFLVEEKQRGRLLSTVDDLWRAYSGADEVRSSFGTCIGRVESRGLIRRLRFGDLVLLQPELLDTYAAALVQAAKEEPDGLGFIPEMHALEGSGRFRLVPTERVSDEAQERLLLIATVEELLRHEIALKDGENLVFPSQFTRELPGAPDPAGKSVIFTFEGPLHVIYATLAVRLAHSTFFKHRDMWQNAASYDADDGGGCGILLREIEEGRGELILFYDDRANLTVRNMFERYVTDHLDRRVVPGTLTRRGIVACDQCGYVLPDDLVKRRLARLARQLDSTEDRAWAKRIIQCPDCEAVSISLVPPLAPVREGRTAEGDLAAMSKSADERRDRNAAAVRIRGKRATGDFDVFLSYNSKDIELVKTIAERLLERGVLPWLDLWEVRPGTRWVTVLDKHLKTIKAAAVFVGPRGQGPWQTLEVEAILNQFARRGRPIIPVILEGRVGQPKMPPFMELWHTVDMRKRHPDPFEMLMWGITDERTSRR
jgi:GTPase SAR1 family protein